MDRPAIVARDLRRTYGRGRRTYEAVRGVDLQVESGTVHALLGVNGAGKTSVLELVEGLVAPSGGTVSVLGLDPVVDRASLRPRTGVVLQRSGFVPDLTVRETLRMWGATVSGARPEDECLEMLALREQADTRMRALSGGEQRRVDLACAVMGRPDVVVLDEPTGGLDPESRRRVWELVGALRDDGVTVLLSTHHLEEAEALSDRISIMAAGRVVREGTVESLVADLPSRITFRNPGTLPPWPRGSARESGGRTTIEVPDLQPALVRLLSWAESEGVALEGLDARSPSLESLFLHVADDRAADVRATARAR